MNIVMMVVMMKMRMMATMMMMVNCCDDDIVRPAGPPPPQSAVKWHSSLEKKARADGKVLHSITNKQDWFSWYLLLRSYWADIFAQIISTWYLFSDYKFKRGNCKRREDFHCQEGVKSHQEAIAATEAGIAGGFGLFWRCRDGMMEEWHCGIGSWKKHNCSKRGRCCECASGIWYR